MMEHLRRAKMTNEQTLYLHFPLRPACSSQLPPRNEFRKLRRAQRGDDNSRTEFYFRIFGEAEGVFCE